MTERKAAQEGLGPLLATFKTLVSVNPKSRSQTAGR